MERDLSGVDLDVGLSPLPVLGRVVAPGREADGKGAELLRARSEVVVRPGPRALNRLARERAVGVRPACGEVVPPTPTVLVPQADTEVVVEVDAVAPRQVRVRDPGARRSDEVALRVVVAVAPAAVLVHRR